MVFVADALQLATQQAVGTHATGNGHLSHTAVDGGPLGFLHKETHNSLLDRGAKVGLVLLDEFRVLFQPVSQEVEEGCLDAGERVVVSCNLRSGKLEGVGIALLGQAVDDGAAGVAEVHDFGCLVDSLAGGVVDCLTKDFHLEMALEQQYLGVAA